MAFLPVRILLLASFALSCRAGEMSYTDWVTKARAASPPQFDVKHVVAVNDACTATIIKGGISTTPADVAFATPKILLTSGVGTIIDICSKGTKQHVFKAQGLFDSSAVWKVVSKDGYVSGDKLVEAIAAPEQCASIYFVPVTPGEYTAELELCPSAAPIAITVAKGTTSDTLKKVDITEPDAVDRSKPIEVDIALVYFPECGLGTPSTEGADGIYEGTSEGTAPAPGPNEGADGIYEGQGEGTASPGPNEGADGVYEGQGEGTAPAPEGADNIYEGTSEGSGASPSPAPVAGRRLAAENAEGAVDPSKYKGTKWFWSEGHSPNGNSLISSAAPNPVEGGATEGAEGATEGAASGRRLLGFGARETRRLVQVPMYDANAHPVEMIVGLVYKINFNTVRAPGASYFAADDFFANSAVPLIEDATTGAEFLRPTAVEVAAGNAYYSIYVKPLKAGTYEFKSSDDLDGAFVGKIKVVDSKDQLSDYNKMSTQDVSTTPCSEQVTSDARTAVAGLLTIALALFVLL